MNKENWLKLLAISGYAIVTVFILPTFFEENPQYRFFFLILACVGLGIILIKLLHGMSVSTKKNKNRQYDVLLAAGIGLDIAVAYQLYDWQMATKYFPVLKRVNETTVMMIAGLTILMVLFLWGIYRILKDSSSTKKVYTPQNENGSGVETAQKDVDNCQTGNMEKTSTSTNSMSGNADVNEGVKLSFASVLGYFVTTIVILGMAVVICYIMITNKNILESLSTNLIKEISYIMIWFIVVLALLLFGIWLAVTAVRYFKKMIGTSREKIIQDDTFLRLISGVILVLTYMNFPNETLDEWTMFMVAPEEIAPLLKIVSVMIFGLIFFELIYLILRFILNPSEKIKAFVINIWDELLMVVSASIMSLVKMVKYVPDILELLMCMISEEDEDLE